jgi:hypothetical protein
MENIFTKTEWSEKTKTEKTIRLIIAIGVPVILMVMIGFAMTKCILPFLPPN